MATTKQINDYFNKVAPMIIKSAKQYGYKYPSAIIAQSALESNYGLSSLAYKYNNYFGMKCSSGWKGKSVNMATWEEYSPGTATNITANFRAYDSLEEGIEGYFTFIKYARYKNLKEATSPEDYISKIKADGWATDSKYVDKVINILEKYNLVKYDSESKENLQEVKVEAPKYTNYKVVKGDSLWVISRKMLGNALRWHEIQELNNLKSSIIYVGQILKIPNK